MVVVRRGVIVGLGLVALGALRGPLFGCQGPVDATQCVAVDEASVCVDRRGAELEVRAKGLLAYSNVQFNRDPIPVAADGGIDGRWFFVTNEYWPTAIYIEATAAKGTGFEGTVDFDLD